LLVIIRWRLGLYRARFHLSALDEFPRAIEAGFLAAGIYALFGLISQFNVTLPDIAWLTATGVALALLRVPLYVILRDLRRNDLARERMLLVGGGLVADAIADMAEDNPDYGLDLAGRVPDLLDVDLAQAAIDTNSSTVLVAFSRASEAREVFEIRRGLAVGLTIMAVPRYFDLIGEDRADDEVFGVPVLRLGAGHPTIGLAIKRGMDILLAATALVLLSPLLAVAGFLVKRETGGDLLFRQTRIGMGGKAFELLKLQTMKPVCESTSDTTWSVTPDSDRLGPVGSFLRKTSIDELPQLWNILRGDMSFVGPRPERPFFVEQFSEQYAHYEDRLRMPAGPDRTGADPRSAWGHLDRRPCPVRQPLRGPLEPLVGHQDHPQDGAEGLQGLGRLRPRLQNLSVSTSEIRERGELNWSKQPSSEGVLGSCVHRVRSRPVTGLCRWCVRAVRCGMPPLRWACPVGGL
jgi:hypothetical protein